MNHLPKVEIKDYNVMFDGKIFFDQPVNSDLKTYENIRKVATGQGDDYTTGCLPDHSYFKENYKMIAIDLTKEQVLDADPRAIQQINFMASLDRTGDTQRCSLLLKKQRRLCLSFHKEHKSFVNAIPLKCDLIFMRIK